MTDYEHSPLWDNETAEWYAEEYGKHFSTTLAVKLAELRPDDVVLEIGCGSGNSCRAAAAVVTGGRVIGIDPTSAMIKIAIKESENYPHKNRVQFMEGSAEEVPLENSSITTAMAINSLHHWDDIGAGLLEAKRILIPDGRFYVADELKKDGTTHGEGRLADPTQIEHLLEDAGFSRVSRTDHIRGGEGMCFYSAVRP